MLRSWTLLGVQALEVSGHLLATPWNVHNLASSGNLLIVFLDTHCGSSVCLQFLEFACREFESVGFTKPSATPSPNFHDCDSPRLAGALWI